MPRFGVEISWPDDLRSEFEIIKKLAGHDNLSKLIRRLLLQWMKEQEATLQSNPIGLRYEVPETKHWIDILLDIEVKKIEEDLQLCEDQKKVSRIVSISAAIKESANRRSLELWKMNKVVEF